MAAILDCDKNDEVSGIIAELSVFQTILGFSPHHRWLKQALGGRMALNIPMLGRRAILRTAYLTSEGVRFGTDKGFQNG